MIQNPIAFSYGDTGIQQTNLAVGDTIRLGDKIVRVVGLTDTPVIINNAGFTNGVQIIVNGELYSYLLGDDSYGRSSYVGVLFLRTRTGKPLRG